MPVLKRRYGQKNLLNNGLYVHSSPPRVLQLNSAHIKQLIRNGDVDKLEQIVLEGQGKKLIGEYASDFKTRTFLKSVSPLMTKISLLHDAVNSGRLGELKQLLEEEPDKKKKLVLAKDESGVGLLHKAVYYDLKDIYRYLIDKYPHIISMKDSEGRTAYHYTPMCKEPNAVQQLLRNAGADAYCIDFKQHSAKYYMDHIQELELPNTHKSITSSRNNTASKESLSFKKSNIRIWIHQRNLANLQQVVWEGHGHKLLIEHSNNLKVKKFLEAVPHIMHLIKDIHTDVINDDLPALKERVNSPIPSIVLSGKDINGLTPLHKAAGLGRQDIAEFIVENYPKSVTLTDNEGKTPLHYATLLKDDGKMTNFLLENGADESVLDENQKTAAYYKTRNSELDSKLLNVIPDSPRIANESFFSNFDWNMITSCIPAEAFSKITEKVNGVIKDYLETDEKPNDSNSNDDEDTKEGETETENMENDENQKSEIDDTKSEAAKNSDQEKSDEDKNQEEINEENSNNKSEEEGSVKDEEEEKNETFVKQEDVADQNNNSKISHSNSEEKSEEVTENEDEIKENDKENPEIEPEGVIEGVVNGENEIETLNEEGQGKSSEDKNEDITALVDEENMERLAAIVLRGDGEKLVGRTSRNPELQSFLDNVTVYMSKINKIHEAARNGNLRDLQAALDRRKFAIAKDNISPNGATPLHTAIVFGNTSIVRYLAGRFPETLEVADDNGRTPLHYASVLADNGHYYNLLVHLGAEARTEDNLGNNAEYYKLNQEKLSHKSLLDAYGAEERVAEEMFDKVQDDKYSARKNLDDEDMISVLDRCYNVLHGRRNSTTISASSNNSTISQQIATLLSKHLKRLIFDEIKLRITKLDHNLFDIIWPSVKKLPTEINFKIALEQDFCAGIVAPDFYVYKVFPELLEPIIKDYNGLDPHFDLISHPDSKFIEDTDNREAEAEMDLDLDPLSKWIISDNNASDSNQVDMPFFATEEGRYLASSLGDPLIKGLTEVANKRPRDPIAYLATYLYNVASNRATGPPKDNPLIASLSRKIKAIPETIDVVTVEPDDGIEEDSAFNATSRDEHGQSMLHFAAARSHGRQALFQLMVETEINIAYRDELYRTARDISIQANIPENTSEIDKYVMHIATKGDTDKLVELLLDGYDHITDIVDEHNVPIIEAVTEHNQADTVSFLQSILTFEEKRERVHHSIRLGSINEVKELLADEKDTGSGKLLAIGKNSYGRSSLHIAVLCQQEEIVDYLANTFPETQKLGDNLERTALHYAMGVEKMETISRVLVKAGSKRIIKDLKGRQPSYYFLNKSDILRLQEEEETF